MAGTDRPRDAAAIEAAVRDQALLAPGRPVLVLLSGGRDSTCLLDLAVRICGPGTVSALHVNYERRAGAVLDEHHCRRLCEERGVHLAIERPGPPPPGAGNFQAWAREVRAGAADTLTAARGIDVASGHTRDDQVETILYRMISSPSRRALLGMAPRGAGRRIRPLLGLSRVETTAYCRERGLAFRDDPTNAEPTYVRNRIRHELRPLLDSLHPGAEANLLALAEVLRDEAQVLDARIEAMLAGRGTLPLAELAAAPRGLARLVLQRLADAVIGAPAAGVARRLDDVLGMGADAILDLPAGVRAVTRAGVLALERTPPLAR